MGWRPRTSGLLQATRLRNNPNLACAEFYTDHSERYLPDRRGEIRHLDTSTDSPEYKVDQIDGIVSVPPRGP